MVKRLNHHSFNANVRKPKEEKVIAHEISTEKGSDAFPAHGRRRKVLVVDGNVAAHQDVLPRLLSSLGYDGTQPFKSEEIGWTIQKLLNNGV
jgi:hypothetical protein